MFQFFVFFVEYRHGKIVNGIQHSALGIQARSSGLLSGKSLR